MPSVLRTEASDSFKIPMFENKYSVQPDLSAQKCFSILRKPYGLKLKGRRILYSSPSLI